MIISELVSLLGFRVDSSGAQQFDATMSRLQNNASNAALNIQNVFQIAAIGISAAFASLAIVGKPIAEAGDAMNGAIAKIKSSLDDSAISGSEAVAVYEKLYEVSTRTGVSANDSAQSFTQLQLAMKDMGYGARDTIDLLEGIQSAGVIAGQSTGDVTEVIRQLGQAFGKGKLNGDELVTLSERMPRLVREIQKEMKMTTAEFFDASSKGKLTPEMLAPAMLTATKNSIKELANFPVGMGMAYKRLTNAAQRFAAELDQELQLSNSIAKVFVWIAQTLDSWRGGLSVIGDIVRELGGLEGIARLVGIALLVAFGGQIFGAIGGLLGLFGMLARAIMFALLPLAGFAAWVIIVEDFIGWMQGKDSLFGRKFGNFDEIIDPLKTKLEEFKSWFTENFNFGDSIENTKREFSSVKDFFTETWTYIKDAWNRNVEGMKPQFEWLMGVGALLKSAFEPLKEFFIGVFNVIMKNFDDFYNKVMTVVNGITGAIRGLLGLSAQANSEGAAMSGQGATSDPAGQSERRARMGARGGLSNFLGPVDPELAGSLSSMLNGLAPSVDVTGRMGGAGGTSNVNAPQTNTITNDITINAPAADPASIASGVNAGMGQATSNMTSRLGSSMALGLGISQPRVESAAIP